VIQVAAVRKSVRVHVSQARAFEVFTNRMPRWWPPPQGLVLAWQIGADWQFDPELITEVEVRFIAESDSVTRVELEHRNLQRMGDRAEQMRTMVDSPGGWGLVLESFSQYAEDLQ
jgi:hypothetical protein